MEAQPTRFMRAILPDALREAADCLAGFLGAQGDIKGDIKGGVQGKDLAFVDNATAGCNAVLRSLRLEPDDEVLVLTHGYNAVRNTVRFVTERAGARMTEAAVPFPAPDADAAADGIVASVAAGLTERTRLAVIDHITSASALVLPLARIIAACHAAGVPVLVDGAHAPGHLDLDVPSTGADFYTGNCHKWLCAPKGSAFLWVSPDRQHNLHPTVISHGLDKGFLTEFDWTGTRDPSAALSVPDAIEFHQQLGGAALRARNIALAGVATGMLARRLNTEPGATGALAGAMGVVRLPVPASEPVAKTLRDRLLEAGTDAPVFLFEGAVWLRLSAFAYNEPEDYARLADLVARVMREVTP